MLTLFGIANCDTVKKAQRWLTQHAIDYRMHDYRRDGLERTLLQKWLTQVDWSDLLNQRSRTWRELDDAQKQDLSKDKAMLLMLAHPTLIKRRSRRRSRRPRRTPSSRDAIRSRSRRCSTRACWTRS